MSSDMASPPLQFESDPALMAANTSGTNYGGYNTFYSNMGYPGTYSVPNSGTPPSLPPPHNSSYASSGGPNNFSFPYHPDTGSTAPSSSGALPTSSAAPLSTPTGTQASDPLDGSHSHPSQHSPHTQQAPGHQATPPQQHPQTPQQQSHPHQQQQQQQPQQPQQPLQRPGGHQPAHTAQSPYQNTSTHHTMGMSNIMHGHTLYPGDARYDARLQQQQPQRYMDPSMQPMMGGRNGSRSGDMWAQPNGMMSDLLNTNHAGGAVRNPATSQGRAPSKQGLGGMNNMGMPMNGMGPMSPMGGLGMPGMPGMNPMGNDRMQWGGMVGAPPSPYGHNGHPQQNMHQQPFHMQPPHPQYPQSNHLVHPQSMPQHLGPHGRVNAPGLGPNAGLERNGGGISKKKLKRPVAVVEKDKNSPKRPRNSYIFFTLMKRDDIKKKHPEFKPTEITKMLGEEWQKLSESEKESYGTMAENDKKRYQAEMENYDSSKNSTANNATGSNVNHGNNNNSSTNNTDGGNISNPNSSTGGPPPNWA
ncbi:non-histone protein [Podila epigama]|nr:non-histone protein [Podila epigama]